MRGGKGKGVVGRKGKKGSGGDEYWKGKGRKWRGAPRFTFLAMLLSITWTSVIFTYCVRY